MTSPRAVIPPSVIVDAVRTWRPVGRCSPPPSSDSGGARLSNAEIGAELWLSVATVKAHVSRLLTKRRAANRVQVALVVQDAGLS